MEHISQRSAFLKCALLYYKFSTTTALELWKKSNAFLRVEIQVGNIARASLGAFLFGLELLCQRRDALHVDSCRPHKLLHFNSHILIVGQNQRLRELIFICPIKIAKCEDNNQNCKRGIATNSKQAFA
jgi:hypothetical protein